MHSSYVAWQEHYRFFLLWEKLFFLMQIIFIVPAMAAEQKFYTITNNDQFARILHCIGATLSSNINCAFGTGFLYWCKLKHKYQKIVT